MPRITYVGPHTDGVEDVAGVRGPVAFGQTVDVSDEVAAALLDQPSNWQAEAPKKSKAPVAEGDEQS